MDYNCGCLHQGDIVVKGRRNGYIVDIDVRHELEFYYPLVFPPCRVVPWLRLFFSICSATCGLVLYWQASEYLLYYWIIIEIYSKIPIPQEQTLRQHTLQTTIATVLQFGFSLCLLFRYGRLSVLFNLSSLVTVWYFWLHVQDVGIMLYIKQFNAT